MSTPIEEESGCLVCAGTNMHIVVIDCDSGIVVRKIGLDKSDNWPEKFGDKPDLYWYNTYSREISAKYIYPTDGSRGHWGTIVMGNKDMEAFCRNTFTPGRIF